LQIGIGAGRKRWAAIRGNEYAVLATMTLIVIRAEYNPRHPKPDEPITQPPFAVIPRIIFTRSDLRR